MIIAALATTFAVVDAKPRKAAKSQVSKEDMELLKTAQTIFKPLPSMAEMQKLRAFTPAQVELGQTLWYDPKLSRDNNLSCNSCHNLATYGVDNRSKSQGVESQLGGRNAPTALNAALNKTQFWDSRAADVEEQAGGPMLNPVEMANANEEAVVKKIAHIPEYQKLFEKAFPESHGAINFKNITTAIAAFERTLLTPSKWDSYLQGNVNALNAQEKRGLKGFIDNGCISCHMGYNLGAEIEQKFGLVREPYWELTGSTQHDEGKFEGTKDEKDKYFFRTPNMRNVAMTYPYFHDGSVWDLGQAVKIMGQAQLGKDFTDAEISDMVAFLNTLTGEVSKEARTMPILPPSNAEASRPVK